MAPLDQKASWLERGTGRREAAIVLWWSVGSASAFGSNKGADVVAQDLCILGRMPAEDLSSCPFQFSARLDISS